MDESERSPADELAAVKEKRVRKAVARERRVLWECGLKGLREGKGLTQGDVAKAVGLSKGGYCEIERGCDPLLTTAVKLCMFFGKRATELWVRRDVTREKGDE